MTRPNSLAIFAKLDREREEQHQAFLKEFGEVYDKPFQGFGLNVAEAAAVKKWYDGLKPEIIATQKKNTKDSHIQDMIGAEPYYGAIGGGLSYAFTPTGLGNICVVTEAITGKSLNVAEATNWFFYG